MGQGLLQNGKRLVRATLLFRLYRTYSEKRAYRKWILGGRPVPPPHRVKQEIIREHARRFRLPVFIETGTYLGDMVEAVKDVFEEVYSIELSSDLYREARTRFKGAPHVTLLQGDSGAVLRDLLPRLGRPCLFWLDGHYSGGITARGDEETPIVKELGHILRHKLLFNHVILIDDARCFTGEGDYPRLEWVRALVNSAGLNYFEAEDDVVRIFRCE